MANMSYCRFENTSTDLIDCQHALEDLSQGDCDPLSSREQARAETLLTTCYEILNEFINSQGMSFEEFVREHGHDPDAKLAEFLQQYQEDAQGGD